MSGIKRNSILNPEGYPILQRFMDDLKIDDIRVTDSGKHIEIIDERGPAFFMDLEDLEKFIQAWTDLHSFMQNYQDPNVYTTGPEYPY